MKYTEVQEMVRIEKQRRFIRAMSKPIDGRPLTQFERTLLDVIFQSLLRGEDVTDLIGTKPSSARRSEDRVFVAVHYLCLTKLMHETAAVAWGVVGDAWGLRKHELQQLIADHRVPALAMLPQFAAAPDTLLRLCERRARGVRHDRRRSGSERPMPSVGDAHQPV
jgi:hypothetical protein